MQRISSVHLFTTVIQELKFPFSDLIERITILHLQMLSFSRYFESILFRVWIRLKSYHYQKQHV